MNEVGDRRGRPLWARLVWAHVLLAVAGPLRAQFTETAVPVEPGQWLVEADLWGFGQKQTAAERHSYSSLGYVQVSRGWRPGVDVQLGWQTYALEKWTMRGPGGANGRSEGAPRAYVRSKWRIVETAEAVWTVALLPLLSVPLEREDGHQFVDVGLLVPVSRRWNEQWASDVQVHLEGNKAAGARREWGWSVSGNVQRTWNERWGTYAEVLAFVGRGRWREAAVSGGLGVTRVLSAQWSGDAVVYRGLSREAYDWELALRVIYQP